MTADHASAVTAFTAFISAMNAKYPERREEIKALTLAVIARKHVLLLGPPGTGKTSIATAFSKALAWKSFVLLLTMTTMPEEVFGPVSLKGLELDQYRRVTSGYMPDAQLTVLDEVFKANSSILNSLLTITNERVYDNGGQRMDVPLEVVVGASNELPRENEGLEALYDRFMFRRWTGYVSSGTMENLMLTSGNRNMKIPDLDRAHVESLGQVAATVDIRPVVKALVSIREQVNAKGVPVSDRRWIELCDVVRACAALAGRTTATHGDLAPLVDCLWNKPEDRGPIAEIISGMVAPGLREALALYDAAVAVFNAAPVGQTGMNAVRGLADALDKINEMTRSADRLPASPEVDEVRTKIVQLGKEIKRANLKILENS